MKISIPSMIFLATIACIFSVPLSFGETGREVFPVEEDSFDNCWDECNDDDYNHNAWVQFLESSYLGGNLINLSLAPSEVYFDVSAKVLAPDHYAPGAVYFKIPIDDIPSSDLFNDVKISKAELQFLALPFPESDDQKGIYSGKLVSSLFLCNSSFKEPYGIPCDYPTRPVDTITVNTEELPKFLVFDITPIIEKAGNKELFFAVESTPIEDLNDLDQSDYLDFFLRNAEEIYSYDYGISENNNKFSQVSPSKIPKIFSEALDQPIRKLYIQKSNFGFARANSINPESGNLSSVTFKIEPDYVTFFIVPSSDNRELSTSSVVVDYEIMDSDLSKAFTYFLGMVLPAIAIIIPAIFWIRKKGK